MECPLAAANASGHLARAFAAPARRLKPLKQPARQTSALLQISLCVDWAGHKAQVRPTVGVADCPRWDASLVVRWCIEQYCKTHTWT
jgi:hypothetical protein